MIKKASVMVTREQTCQFCTSYIHGDEFTEVDEEILKSLAFLQTELVGSFCIPTVFLIDPKCIFYLAIRMLVNKNFGILNFVYTLKVHIFFSISGKKCFLRLWNIIFPILYYISSQKNKTQCYCYTISS